MSLPAFISQLASNPVFAGIAGGAGVSALLYQARALPVAAWRTLQRQMCVTLVIDNSDRLFDLLALHLSRSPYVSRARWLRMVEWYDDEAQRWTWAPSFGLGWHIFREEGCWFVLYRHIEDKAVGGRFQGGRTETITIRAIGRSQDAMRALMKRAEASYEIGASVRVHIFHDGRYALADRKAPRDLATIFLPAGQKERIVADLLRFGVSRERYRARGIPYRRGYLFEGPPGTGKTSLAYALASLTGRAIYIVNLATCGGDTGLQIAFNDIEPGAFVVLEDIDTIPVSHDRAAPSEPGKVPVDAPKIVTLAGLLNAIDGLGSRENRILIITTNHAEQLDPALLRPGRIDLRETIGLLGRGEAAAMTAAFLGSDSVAWFDGEVAPLLPIAPAVLQGMLTAKAFPAESVSSRSVPRETTEVSR